MDKLIILKIKVLLLSTLFMITVLGCKQVPSASTLPEGLISAKSISSANQMIAEISTDDIVKVEAGRYQIEERLSMKPGVILTAKESKPAFNARTVNSDSLSSSEKSAKRVMFVPLWTNTPSSAN